MPELNDYEVAGVGEVEDFFPETVVDEGAGAAAVLGEVEDGEVEEFGDERAPALEGAAFVGGDCGVAGYEDFGVGGDADGWAGHGARYCHVGEFHGGGSDCGNERLWKVIVIGKESKEIGSRKHEILDMRSR